jgi:hypothetical protein
MTTCGLMVLNIFSTTSSKPLNTDRMMISAALPTKTPTIDIPEMMFMALVDFLAKRYLRAM